jgi:hypothetical protein
MLMKLLLVPFQVATVALGIGMVRIWIEIHDLCWIHYVFMSCMWTIQVILVGGLTKVAYSE